MSVKEESISRERTKKERFKVIIKPGDEEIEVDQDETILEATLRHGYMFPYSCCNAICGTCRGKVVSGEVYYDDDLEIYGITEEEIAEGYALFCSAKPKTDLEICFDD